MSTQTASAIAHQLAIRPDWLATVTEAIVEPDSPIIDPHHHLWDGPGRRYLFDDLLADIFTGHKVAATVFVQCHSMYRAFGPDELKPIGETEFVAGAAAQSESGLYGPTRICAGIVGSLDFTLGHRVEPVLEAHVRAGGGRFRGIRGRTSWDASPDVHRLPTGAHVLMDPRSRAAIKQIEKFGLSLDIWCFHTQMDEVIDVCRAFPALTIIVNHIAGPIGIGPYRDRRDEIFAVWSGHVAALAALPNTVMKLGGMAMRFTGNDFHLHARPPTSDELVQAWQPYVTRCIEAFGPARCMFESNFPVDKAMCSYPLMWNAFKKMASGYSASERADLLAGTAARVYRLPLEAA